jgi:hypothetical protein
MSIRGTEFFLWETFFFQNLHFGPIRWVPRRFLKISINYSQNLHFNLCAAHIGMGGVKIEKEPRQVDEYVYRIS